MSQSNGQDKFHWRDLGAMYVNLPHRTDRNEHMIKELMRVGLAANRYEGLLTKTDEWNRPPYQKLFARTRGAIGCYLSQMSVMQICYNNGRGAMVLEDDLIFASDIQKRLDYIENFVNAKAPDVDVIFLGGTVHMKPPYWHGNPHNPDLAPYCTCHLGVDYEKINDAHMVRVFGMFSTHAYIVPYRKIPKILSLLQMVTEVSYGIDFSFIMLQPNLNCYAFLPGSVSQMDNMSDIGNGMTVFSGFKMLGPHWFADNKNEFELDCPIPEVNYRQDLVPLLKYYELPLVVAEVGVAEGLFSKEMLDAGVKHLYLIDLWAHQPGIVGDGGSPQAWHDKNFSDISFRLEKYEHEGKVSYLRGYSTKQAEYLSDEILGMAYIDCNHEYEYVKADSEAYWPKIVPGGIMAFHDYNNIYPGVKRAVNEFAQVRGLTVNLIPDKDESYAGAWIRKPL